MKANNKKFAIISAIYTQFTDENKENLIISAKNLLKTQRKDTEIIKKMTMNTERIIFLEGKNEKGS